MKCKESDSLIQHRKWNGKKADKTFTLSWHGTGTSIKNDGVKLVLCTVL